MHYGADNTLTFVARNGDVYTITIGEGGNTGCAKLPALFSIAAQEALKPVREQHPDVVIMGTMDDNYIVGKLADVLAAYADMKAAFRLINLELHDGKLELWSRLALEQQQRRDLVDAGVPEDKLPTVIVDGVEVAGSPVGTADFVERFLDERYKKLDGVATRLEKIAPTPGVTWQGLLALVQQCVATANLHLARTLPPDTLRAFAAKVDERMARLSLRASGLGKAGDEGIDADGVQLRFLTILLSAKQGGLDTPSLSLTLEPAFVACAALIGPAITELTADAVDLSLDGAIRRALASAINECKNLLPPEREAGGVERAGDTGADDDSNDDDDDDEPAPEAGREGKPQDADTRKRSPAAAASVTGLRKLSIDTIFDESKRGFQRVLHKLFDANRYKKVLAELDERVRQGKPHAAKKRARFLEGRREHASAWLTASRRDKACCMENGFFRVAVAIRTSVNPFSAASPTARCYWCEDTIGDDLYAHCIECSSTRKGDNNRRHQQLQQVLENLCKSVREGRVQSVPNVLAFFGAGAHETGYAPPVTAQARPTHKETAEQNGRRQGDIGLVDVFSRGQTELVDLTVSDGGGASPSATYAAGKLCLARALQKQGTYTGPDGRFVGLKPDQLTILSFDCMGGMTKATKQWLQTLIEAIADADPSVAPSVIASRVWSSVSVSLQSSLAQNALLFCNRLLQPARVVGQQEPLLPVSGQGSTAALAQPQQSQSRHRSGSRGGAARSQSLPPTPQQQRGAAAAAAAVAASTTAPIPAALGITRRSPRAAGGSIYSGEAAGATCPLLHDSQAGTDAAVTASASPSGAAAAAASKLKPPTSSTKSSSRRQGAQAADGSVIPGNAAGAARPPERISKTGPDVAAAAGVTQGGRRLTRSSSAAATVSASVTSSRRSVTSSSSSRGAQFEGGASEGHGAGPPSLPATASGSPGTASEVQDSKSKTFVGDAGRNPEDRPSQ